jgi:hypothetical protein
MQGQKQNKPQWPDLQDDRLAFEMAKKELGAQAPLSDVLLRAQRLKEKMRDGS